MVFFDFDADTRWKVGEKILIVPDGEDRTTIDLIAVEKKADNKYPGHFVIKFRGKIDVAFEVKGIAWTKQKRGKID